MYTAAIITYWHLLIRLQRKYYDLKYLHNRAFVGIAIIAVIATAVSTMMFLGDRSVSADSRDGEPLTAELFDLYSGGSKDYIAQTGRMVMDEDGRVEIKFDRPEVPSVKESIKMAAAALEANDSSLLPYCSVAYLEYLASTKDSRGTTPVAGNMSACIAIPNRIGLSGSGSPVGATNERLLTSIVYEHTGYVRTGSTVDQNRSTSKALRP